MYELFDEYWWLVFPLGLFLLFAFNSFLSYQKTKAKIELLKTYAASGKEPPAELVRRIDGDVNPWEDWEDKGGDDSSGAGSSAFLVILFVGLSAVFAAEGRLRIIGIGEEAYFIAMIMSVLAIAFLAGAIFRGGRK